ncbi:hypothetical protein SKM62_00340 [Acinetobacter faecalis]|uniref:hypothetical protein n=1 Tax=Acinetobacter faecalis TaxID=2665161 RepID=UPI002A91A509|nr:hypothetical protein [Acinetobacter faecalis]MDY6535396.1 hypothetical protein [Acinetobacter faecalis]
MKTYVPFLMPISFIFLFSVYANTNVKSKLFLQQDAQEMNSDATNGQHNVDFFELAKKNEPQPAKPTLDWDSSTKWDSSATVNMSEHEKSQYLFNQRNYSGLNNHVNAQRVDALKKARDDGKMSNKQYQKEINILKMHDQSKKPGSVGFSIPFE